MLTLRNLFSASKREDLVTLNTKCDLSHVQAQLKRAACTKYTRSLTKLLLDLNPETRPNAKQALTHPWFNRE